MVQIQKTVEGWYAKIQKEISSKITHFVAFFFFVIALGVLIGISVATNHPNQVQLAVILPAAAGLLAYYNRTFATIVFVILLILVFVV